MWAAIKEMIFTLLGFIDMLFGLIGVDMELESQFRAAYGG